LFEVKGGRKAVVSYDSIGTLPAKPISTVIIFDTSEILVQSIARAPWRMISLRDSASSLNSGEPSRQFS
jgi:hypothetical protein